MLRKMCLAGEEVIYFKLLDKRIFLKEWVHMLLRGRKYLGGGEGGYNIMSCKKIMSKFCPKMDLIFLTADSLYSFMNAYV